MANRNILISGGAGFIGSHFVDSLTQAGISVLALGRKPYSSLSALKQRLLSKAVYKQLDMKEIHLIKHDANELMGTDLSQCVFINLAWGGVDRLSDLNINAQMNNVAWSVSALNVAKEIGCKKFVQIGSSIEYGKLKSPQKENKKNLQKTYSFYGKAKLLSTRFILSLYKKYNFPATILRLYLVYGPMQDPNRVIPIVIINAIQNKKFDCSDGLQLRDFTYIDDVVEAIIKTLKNKDTSGQIINIGQGKPVSVKKVINKICKLLNSGRPQFGKIKFRKDEIKNLYPSIIKAKKVLNWTPKTGIISGLKKTIKYYKKMD